MPSRTLAASTRLHGCRPAPPIIGSNLKPISHARGSLKRRNRVELVHQCIRSGMWACVRACMHAFIFVRLCVRVRARACGELGRRGGGKGVGGQSHSATCVALLITEDGARINNRWTLIARTVAELPLA